MRILLLNPNCSSQMTDGMLAAAKSLPISEGIDIQPYTATEMAPASINDDDGIQSSTACVLYDLSVSTKGFLETFDAVLVACYSVHSLVPQLQKQYNVSVLGIFEASVLTALSITKESEQWGIVTTGHFWEQHLSDGVKAFLGQGPAEQNRRFAGVFSSGLTAGDFHTVSPEQVKEKLRDATLRLLKSGNVSCVVMGCGGMAGLEDIIRGAAEELNGSEAAKALYIIDGVQAGILQLHQIIQSRRAFV